MSNRDKILEEVREMVNKVKEYDSNNCALSDTIEIFHIRSYLLKNFGINYNDISTKSVDEIVEHVKDILDGVREVDDNRDKIKVNIDDLIDDSESENPLISDSIKVLRKEIVKRSVHIGQEGKKFKIEMSDGTVVIKIPKNYDVSIGKLNNVISNTENENGNDKEEVEATIEDILKDNTILNSGNDVIILSNDYKVPILKKCKKRYRVIRNPLRNFTRDMLNDVYHSLRDFFGDEKAMFYFMKTFGIHSRKQAKEMVDPEPPKKKDVKPLDIVNDDLNTSIRNIEIE